MRWFDYIVVGAGSAGCILASRLTEDPSCTVLLLEAGHEPTGVLRDMPGSIFKMMAGRPDLSWNFTSEPEPGLDGRKVPLPRGKTLGGSSQINGLVYTRGHASDFDEWARLSSPDWDWQHVRRYFERFEASIVSAPDHGRLLQDTFRTAAIQAGHQPAQLDPRSCDGFVPSELTADRRGRRMSAHRAFLRPVRGRPNLTVVSGAHASRVLIERGRATGVEYMRRNRMETAHCDGEVILCGGVYGSPQLLLLSGIGPPEAIRAAGLAPLVDRAEVGANLAEHPMTWLHYVTKEPSLVEELRWDRAAAAVARWALLGRGLFASNFCGGHLFARSSAELAAPDIQVSCFPIDKNAKLWFPLVRRRAAYGQGLMLQLVRPASRGSVTLAGSDPRMPPRISLNLLTEPRDVDAMVAAIRIGRQLLRQPALQAMGATEDMPGPQCTDVRELQAYLRRVCMIGQHAAGTCRMGSDADSVVDPHLRVRGVQGLRVVDASVMPIVTRANTNAAAMMIACKAADMILHPSLGSPVEKAAAGEARGISEETRLSS
ncbi:MAG TPA: GMC family oxidoreductase N-terminal domain-containing protein [Ramlibacter sp.]|uniref:GMC family oxidoreductase n=1 Tax=Ramlibacter sp. TaxID=1917967 RepID=UPI002CED4E87|nr:GMC family oxidoreductase N-terminal domain-containing protein [Ramlibacter sp.]HVZ46506.1 GMC family oxidoreductase N-terminal domain-containing protein [Ramlibacter sp.]